MASILHLLKKKLLGEKKIPTESSAVAYDKWAGNYDLQPDNLMLALDEQLVAGLLAAITLSEPVITDIGCGTGRHWPKLYALHPKQLTGFDVSAGMLEKLQEKFPDAVTMQLTGNLLPGIETGSCDLAISTLTVAHIQDIPASLAEWTRILKPGGYLLITDYHPDALARGGKRTFSANGKTIAILNYVHSTQQIQSVLGQLGMQIIRFEEKKVDVAMRPFYEKQKALAIYEQWRGTPIIYGMLLRKPDAIM